MPLLNRAAELQNEAREWRHHLHAHPEILYEVHNTAAFVAEKLKEFGVDEIVTGIGRTGVVGVIKGRGDSDRAIGLRADMDALPLEEITGKPWASKSPARCMPAAMTDTPPCCWALPNISVKPATSTDGPW